MGSALVLAFLLAIIWMLTEIPVIGPVIKWLIIIAVIWFLIIVFMEYQKISHEHDDYSNTTNSYYR